MEIESNDISNHYIPENETTVFESIPHQETSRLSMEIAIDSDGFEGSRLGRALLHAFIAGIFAVAVFVLLIFGFWIHHDRRLERQRRINHRRRCQTQDAQDWDAMTEIVDIND
ncbi:unnamed protein product [Allacma fusca]|uniref:Uncharacterized protein n=1 Tax=Allacma fusca TaxID=39272 RepID=A0A8J2KF23_9HEXA|nr:unnamed protein product [Allacma fusca]